PVTADQSQLPAMPPPSELRLSLSIASHAVALLCVAAPSIALHSGVRPFRREFFCTDESIAYPYRKDTVPFAPAFGGGIAVAVATILVRCLSERSAGFVSALLRALYAGVFGLLCTELVTVAGKLGFGRQRPHFLAVCQLLNASACRPGLLLSPLGACGAAAVAPKALDEASIMFVAVFLALYLQARLGFRHPMHPVKNVYQLALLALAGSAAACRFFGRCWLVRLRRSRRGASYELVASADISKGRATTLRRAADALPLKSRFFLRFCG
uniref:AcidPPc domain-containing protein n=1 Tax=Macrostomum lignano TaxID=282301 RepID=A0A1I8G9I9_9PLAT